MRKKLIMFCLMVVLFCVPASAFSGKNLFDSSLLLNAEGWTESDGVYSGSVLSLYKSWYSSGDSFPIDFEKGVFYTLSFYARCDGNSDTTGNGLVFMFRTSDGSKLFVIPNSTQDWTYFSYTIESESDVPLDILGLYFSFYTGWNNKWHLKNIQIEKGTVATDYVPFGYVDPDPDPDPLPDAGVFAIVSAMGVGFFDMAADIGRGLGGIVPSVIPLIGLLIAIGFVLRVLKSLSK